MTAAPGRPRLRNAGTLVSCTVGLGTASLVLTNYAMGAFVYPLTEAFGWSRRDIMFAYSAMTVATICVSSLAGWLTDRVAPRALIVPSQIAFGLSFGLLAIFVSKNLWTFYALHVVLAVVALGCLPVAFSSIVAATFTRNRGLAFGVMLTGSGLCGVLVPPYLAWLIENYGWRAAYAGLGLVPIGGALLLSMPLLPVRQLARPADPAAQSNRGVPLAAALRDRRLWTIALSLFLGAGLSTAVVSNFVPLLRDQGIAPVSAASVLSVFGLAVIIGRLVVGWLIDRFWAPPIALAVMVPASLALLLLASMTSVSLPTAFVCALFLGLAAGAEGDMLSYLGVQYFGLAHAGKIYGFVYIFFTIGIGIGGPIFGAVYDMCGTYRPALYAGSVAWIVCGALLLTLGPYPDFGEAEAAATDNTEPPSVTIG